LKSGRPRLLPPSDQVIIPLGHLLSFMCTTCPHHFNVLFSIHSITVLPAFFSDYFPFFLLLVVWRPLLLFFKNL
jgi:hypothetical protein